MQRSRIDQTLNGDPAASPLGGAHRLGAPYSSHRAPQRIRLDPSLAAALWDSLFEHPAGVCSCGATRGDHRSSAVSKWLFRSLRGLELLLSLIRQRSIQHIHPVDGVPQSGISQPPFGQIGQIGQTRWSGTLGRANEVQIGIRSGPA